MLCTDDQHPCMQHPGRRDRMQLEVREYLSLHPREVLAAAA